MAAVLRVHEDLARSGIHGPDDVKNPPQHRVLSCQFEKDLVRVLPAVDPATKREGVPGPLLEFVKALASRHGEKARIGIENRPLSVPGKGGSPQGNGCGALDALW